MVDKVSFKETLKKLDKVEIEAVPVIKDSNLIKMISAEATLDEAEKVWPILESSLDLKKGYGLAAIQIGIPKKIALVKYGGKTYRLLNTRIISKHNEFIMPQEGCLCMPGKRINTVRYSRVTIEDDVLGKLTLDESSFGLLPIIMQHEVDHFEGLTILDRRQVPIIHKEKISRNASCPCGSGKKYKKCCLL